MANEYSRRDANRVTTTTGITNSGEEVANLRLDDTTKRLRVTTTADDSFTSIGEGSKVIGTASSVVVLAASTICKKILLQARYGNQGDIAVGGSLSVSATSGSEVGIVLVSGQTLEFPTDNLNDVYLDATFSGDGVSYIYFV